MTEIIKYHTKPYRIQGFTKQDGYFIACTVDLIFVDDIPFAVFDWKKLSDTVQEALVTQQLDPSLLEPSLSGEITHLYHGQIEDPRTKMGSNFAADINPV